MFRRIVASRLFYRITESIVPLLSWTIITFPIWFSPFHPAVVSYFIIGFLLYFLYKSIKTVYFAGISYNLMRRSSKVNWHKKLIKTEEYKKITHFVIITTFKESYEKLDHTIAKIQNQKYPKSRVNVVLAMEEDEGEEAILRSRKLTEKYRKSFANFYTTYHKLVEGEVVGKASNETYAARFIEEKVKQSGLDPKKVIITICDADSLLPEDYLAYLTYEFIKDRERQYHFYWAPVLLYSNFWRLPLPIRVQAILSSVARLSFLSWKDDLIQISTYSTNLWLLKEVGYWHTDVIPEDWHIWLQAFFKFGRSVRTMPIYLPISRDAVLARGILKTFKNRYLQERRWSWGASDIPYAIKRFFETPHIEPILKLRKILFLCEAHLLWPTTFFVLTLSGYIPPLVNPVFKRTVMGFLLPQLSSIILTIASILILAILFFDYKMREKVKIKTRLRDVPLLFIQWFFLPIISFVFSSLPALEAHTRMMLGKKLEYKVTEKI